MALDWQEGSEERCLCWKRELGRKLHSAAGLAEQQLSTEHVDAADFPQIIAVCQTLPPQLL